MIQYIWSDKFKENDKQRLYKRKVYQELTKGNKQLKQHIANKKQEQHHQRQQ